jgi:uncharacterized protein (TIGR02996 family)
MSDEAALLAAIVAHADEDTPRLAFADWLDENGDPDRAEFIRSQCRFAAASATQPDYPEVYHGYFLGRSRAWWWVRANPIPIPPWARASDDVAPATAAHRRGFLYRLQTAWDGPPDAMEVDGLCDGLAELVATTTVRALDLPDLTAAQLARVLAAPGAEKLTGLTVGPTWGDGDELARVLGAAKSVRGLTELTLHFAVTGAGARALARAPFDRLETFDMPGLDCSAAALTALTATRWFRRLKTVCAQRTGRSAQPALLGALARLPKLDRLILRLDHADGLGALATADGFPALGYLSLLGSIAHRAAGALARGRFPKMQALEITDLRNTEFRALLAADWFPQLLMLEPFPGRLTDRSVRALARSPAAANLRYLRLGDNRLGATGLALLADGTKFPSATLLDLDCKDPPNLTPLEARRFVARITLPRLRTLYLDSFPLGNEGARALANNPALAGVDSLSVGRCGLTDRGFNALARSPHLANVVNLTADGNRIRSPAALSERGTLPGLRHLWLFGNRVPPRTAAKLRAARDWVVEIEDE